MMRMPQPQGMTQCTVIHEGGLSYRWESLTACSWLPCLAPSTQPEWASARQDPELTWLVGGYSC